MIRELRPQVVVTYDASGGYGHPDHIQSHRVTMRAIELATAAGIGPAKVYWSAIPRSVMQAGLDAFVNSTNNPFEGVDNVDDIPMAVPDDLIAARIDANAFAGADAAAEAPPSPADVVAVHWRGVRLRVHGRRVLPAGVRQASAGPVGGWEDDLFAGLPAAPAASPTEAGPGDPTPAVRQSGPAGVRRAPGPAAAKKSPPRGGKEAPPGDKAPEGAETPRQGRAIRPRGSRSVVAAVSRCGRPCCLVGRSSPHRIGTVLVPVSVVLGVGGNMLISAFRLPTTSSKVIALAPGCSGRAHHDRRRGTTERDYILLQSNWVAITIWPGCARWGLRVPPD